MGPIPGDGSPGVVLASPGAPLAVWQQPTVLPPRDWGRIPQLMRTGSPAALTLWERQLSFQMEESKIGNEWKMNFFWGCQWLEEGSWTGRASADYTLCVYQGGNLAKCTGADVMVTDHTCCLNRIWILDGVIFDSIWVLTSLVLEVEILRLIPICRILIPSGFGKFGPGLWCAEKTTNIESLSGKRGNSGQMLEKCFFCYWKASAPLPSAASAWSWAQGRGALHAWLCPLVSQSPWPQWLDILSEYLYVT